MNKTQIAKEVVKIQMSSFSNWRDELELIDESSQRLQSEVVKVTKTRV